MRKHAITALWILGIIAAYLAWAGDIPWINDEPLFLKIASDHNAAGTWAVHGNKGSRIFHYGALPFWFFQIALKFCSGLTSVAFFHAFIFISAMIAAVLVLGRISKGLLPWFGFVCFLSPYVWIHTRMLWDVNFLLPFCVITMASYGWFCKRQHRRSFALLAAAMLGTFWVQLLALPLLFALTICLALFHRKWLWKNRAFLICCAVVVLLVNIPYLRIVLFDDLVHRRVPHDPSEYSAIKGWWFPLTTGRYFTGFRMDYFFDPRWFDRIALFSWMTAIAIPGVLISMVLAAKEVARQGPPRSITHHLLWLCLLTVPIQMAMQGYARTYWHAHYYIGTWFCYFYLLWWGVSTGFAALKIPTAGLKLLRCAYAASLAVCLLNAIYMVHTHAGNRSARFGTTMAEQLRVAREVSRYYPASPLNLVPVNNYRMFTSSFPILRTLEGMGTDPKGPLKYLRVDYRDEIPADAPDFVYRDGHLKLVATEP